MNEFENVEKIFPLSPIQEGMLYHTLSATRAGVFITQVCVNLSGSLDPEQLRAAWQRVVGRHAALRTAFFWDGLDEPLQVVRSTVDLPWQELDWRDRDAADFETFLAADREQALDLTHAPAMRLVLLRTGERCWRHVWTIHHMVADGWSANIVLRDVLAELAQSGHVRPSPHYAAYVDRALNANTPEAQSFWAERLAHRDECTRITDPLVIPETGHAHLRRAIGSEDTARLIDFARSCRVTLNTVVLGAWARLLATCADDESPIFGTTVTVRPPDMEDIEEAVGVYLNTLPMEVPLRDEPLRDWLNSIQAQSQAMQPHALMSLTDIQAQSGIARGKDLFQSIVVFENHDAPEETIRTALAGTTVEARFDRIVDQSNYALALLAIPGKELGFELIFDRAVFGEDFAAALLESMHTILLGFAENPDVRPASVATAAFRSDAKDPAADAPPPLHEVIGSRDPQAPALRAGAESVSYGKLNSDAERVAARLSKSGIGKGDFVGLYARRGTAFVTGMLGIMKSGAAFVPMDPGYPATLNAEVAGTMSLSMILAEPAMIAEAQGLSGAVLTTDRANEVEISTQPEVGPEDIAYVIHTSGSQGARKGVLVRHDNIAYSTVVRRQVYGRGPERFLLLSPVAFDSAMVGLFWTLSEGGTLVLPEPGQEKDVDEIARLIEAENVTHLLCIPSLYRLLLEFAPRAALTSLDTVIVAGEACHPDIAVLHQRTIPHVRLFNEYGPTEALVWCLAAELKDIPEGEPVPIGRPIPGTTAYLLDRWGQPVPDGVAGELCVAGPGIAAGYLGMPEATAEKFVEDPFAPGQRMYRTGDLAVRRAGGAHVFFGRTDDQIKLNGFRIEPMEIANALQGHPDVEEALVALRSPAVAQDVESLARLLSGLREADAERLLTTVEAMTDGQVTAELEKN